MGFFLLGRDRNSDELRLLTSDLVETSEAALERLSVLVSTPEIRSLELDYFIGNFAAATPVLLVVPAQPEALPVEGDAGVWETPISYSESDAVLEEILSEAIIEVPVEPEAAEATPVPVEPEVAEATPVPVEPEAAEASDTPEAETQADVSLAEALKRAADTLESEGIQAPPSVGLAEPEPWPWESEREEALPVQLDPLEESSVDADPLLPIASPDDDFLPPRPVIMGDYPEIPREPISEEPALLAGSFVETDAPPLEVVHASPHPVSVLDDLTIVTPDSEPPVPSPTDNEGQFLTCDDCVYVATCPNKDESSPDNCGNFQWKSG